VILALAWISYRNTLTAAARFTEAQLVLFDLHRFVLYDTLNAPGRQPRGRSRDSVGGSRALAVALAALQDARRTCGDCRGQCPSSGDEKVRQPLFCAARIEGVLLAEIHHRQH